MPSWPLDSSSPHSISARKRMPSCSSGRPATRWKLSKYRSMLFRLPLIKRSPFLCVGQLPLYEGAAEGACCTKTCKTFKILVDFADIDTDTATATATGRDTEIETATETKKKNKKLFFLKTETETAKGTATATETETGKEKAAPAHHAEQVNVQAFAAGHRIPSALF